MSVSDRVRRNQRERQRTEMLGTTDTDTIPSGQSSLPNGLVQVQGESPLAFRLRLVLDHLSMFVHQHGDERTRRIQWIIEPFIEEITTQLSGLDQGTMETYWNNVGLLFQWVGTGNEENLPPEVLAFVSYVMGRTEEPEEPLFERREIPAPSGYFAGIDGVVGSMTTTNLADDEVIDAEVIED